MRTTLLRICLVIIIAITGFSITTSIPVKADGGPILTDPELWGMLEEGQQTAVITLKENDKEFVCFDWILLYDRTSEQTIWLIVKL